LPGEFLRSRRVCKKRKDRRNFSGQGTETVLSQWGTGRPFARLCRSGCGGLRGAGKKFDESLRGKPEKLAWARDAKGKKLFLHVEKSEWSEDDSTNLVLTIDNRIQYLVENHLREAVLSKGAKSGIAIVMDPKTGEILALANQLGFNPNHVKGLTPEVWRNRAITDVLIPVPPSSLLWSRQHWKKRSSRRQADFL